MYNNEDIVIFIAKSYSHKIPYKSIEDLKDGFINK